MKSFFPSYRKPLHFIFFWTLIPGFAGAVMITLYIFVVAIINNDWDWRLVGIPIIAGAILFAVLGLISSAVCAIVLNARNRKKGAG